MELGGASLDSTGFGAMDWNPLRPLKGLQETRVATREESGVLGFPSRRGLTPRGSLAAAWREHACLQSLWLLKSSPSFPSPAVPALGSVNRASSKTEVKEFTAILNLPRVPTLCPVPF